MWHLHLLKLFFFRTMYHVMVNVKRLFPVITAVFIFFAGSTLYAEDVLPVEAESVLSSGEVAADSVTAGTLPSLEEETSSKLTEPVLASSSLLEGLYTGSLSNGLLLCFFQDPAVPSGTVTLAVRAGTSVQTPETTGLAELYARLFYEPAGGKDVFYNNGAFSASTECSGDYALYSSTFAADRLQTILELYAACLKGNELQESSVKREYSTMKAAASDSSSALEKYINGAIDICLFPDYPWSRETGLNADCFASYGLQELCSLLDVFGRKFYMPSNTMLCVSGPYLPDEVYSLAVSIFDDGLPSEVQPVWTVETPAAYVLQMAAGMNETEPQDGINDESAVCSTETAGISVLPEREVAGGRYVLTGDAFSKDFNQLTVQYLQPDYYVTPETAAAAETAALMLENGSAFKPLVLSDSTNGVMNTDWLYVSSSVQQTGVRLIVQALMEDTGISPGKQVLSILEALGSDGLFPEVETPYFSRIAADRLPMAARDPAGLFHALAEDWALSNPVVPELNSLLLEKEDMSVCFNTDSVESYSAAYEGAALSLTSDRLHQVLLQEPYVFLMLNTEVYSLYQEELLADGFQLLDPEDALWYKADVSSSDAAGSSGSSNDSSSKSAGDGASNASNASNDSSDSAEGSRRKSFASLMADEIYALYEQDLLSGQVEECSSEPVSGIQNGDGAVLAEDNDSGPAFNGSIAYERYVAYSENGLKRTVLSNGIPVTTMENTTEDFLIRFSFESGMEGLSLKERGLWNIVADVIADNISQFILMSGAVPYTGFSVSTEDGVYGVSVTVRTISQYAYPVLYLAAEALVFGDISAAQVDESLYQRNSNWSLLRSDSDFQLYSSAMQLLYEGLSGEGYFDLGEEYVSDISFEEVEMEYLKLLEPSSFSLFLAGRDSENYVPVAENMLGFLRDFSSSQRRVFPQFPEANYPFPLETQTVTFHRIFSTNVKPGEYVVQPAKLIPTEVFYDPLHMYLACPSFDSLEYPLYLALLAEMEDMLNERWAGGADIHIEELYQPVACIRFLSVSEKKPVDQVYKAVQKEMTKDFTEERIKKLQTLFIERYLLSENRLSTAASLVEEGALWCFVPETWLYQFETLMNATPAEYRKAALYLVNSRTLTVMSEDTK